MALLIEPDGSLQIIVGEGPMKTLTYKQIKQALNDGYMEVIACDPAINDGRDHMLLDEDGKIKKLPPNWAATRLSTYTANGDVLCGPVLVCRTETLEDGQTGSV